MDCRIKQQETMKSNFMKQIHNYLLINLLLLSQLSQAQPGFNDNVDDVPVASIDKHIILLLFVGVIVIFYFLRKKETIKSN